MSDDSKYRVTYQIRPHTNSSQLVIGTYDMEAGVTKEEVEARVKGTFGGRFTRFEQGRFEYVAYTD